MDWRMKSAIRHFLLALPGGERLYRGLTAGVLGTNAGMAYKWFRVFPAHIRVLRDAFGEEARAQRLWCYDCGATPAAGFAMAIASDAPGLLTDRLERLRDRYLAVSRRVLAEQGGRLQELSAASPERLVHLWNLTAGRSARRALEAAGMQYAAGHVAAEDAAWRGSIGCVFSAGTLEHYPPEVLEAEVARMARVLAPRAVLSHVVDHRDHRWHADKRIDPLAHLMLDDDAYRRQFGNALDYHNRRLRSYYVELFTRHGFHVRCLDVITAATIVSREQLAPAFRGASDEDLRSLVTHFVAVRG